MWEKFIINKIYRINYLEIGSFEGRSTAFIGEKKILTLLQQLTPGKVVMSIIIFRLKKFLKILKPILIF